jgi:hypothetical protein
MHLTWILCWLWFSISSLDFWLLHQVSSFFWLLFVFFHILFLIGIIFQFHLSWFDFILFLCQIWFLFFSNIYIFLFFLSFLLIVFSILPLIILVSWEFDTIIFWFCHLCYNPTSWFISWVLKIKLGWIHSFLGPFFIISFFVSSLNIEFLWN